MGDEALLLALTSAIEALAARTDDRERLVQTIAEQAATLLDVTCVAYLLSEDGLGWGTVARAPGATTAADIGAIPLPSLARDDPAVLEALASGRPSELQPGSPGMAPGSVLVPLRSGNRSWGVLAVHRLEEPGAPPLRPLDTLIACHLAQAAALSLAHAEALARASRDWAPANAAALRGLSEANRLKSEFLANMSHELRTPLNAIIGFTSLLHAGRVGKLTETQVEYLGDVLVSSRHLLQLINDVLDLAKVEAGRVELQIEQVNLSRAAAEVKDILRGLAAERHIEMVFDVAVELGEVSTDSRSLKQILYNYLSNAIKFTPDYGKVQVRIQPSAGANFKIEVEDNGIGIAEEELGRLFIEFQQLDSTTGKNYSGTGLGLALTKRIVEMQGGTVGVVSAVGKGSTFSAELPRTLRPPKEGLAHGR